ncbi:hypothetical protein THAOC_06099, partial [Thalassiosira oceanica]
MPSASSSTSSCAVPLILPVFYVRAVEWGTCRNDVDCAVREYARSVEEMEEESSSSSSESSSESSSSGSGSSRPAQKKQPVKFIRPKKKKGESRGRRYLGDDEDYDDSDDDEVEVIDSKPAKPTSIALRDSSNKARSRNGSCSKRKKIRPTSSGSGANPSGPSKITPKNGDRTRSRDRDSRLASNLSSRVQGGVIGPGTKPIAHASSIQPPSHRSTGVAAANSRSVASSSVLSIYGGKYTASTSLAIENKLKRDKTTLACGAIVGLDKDQVFRIVTSVVAQKNAIMRSATADVASYLRNLNASQSHRSARSAWKEALSRALGPGIAGRVLERPGKARKASIHRKLDSGLRQRVPLVVGKTRPAAPTSIVLCGRTAEFSTGSRNCTKSSFLESSRRALQLTLDRRIRIDGARAVRAREMPRRLAKSSRRDDEEESHDSQTHPAYRGGVLKTDAARPGGSRKKRRTALMRRRLGRHPAYCGASRSCGGGGSKIGAGEEPRLQDRRSSRRGRSRRKTDTRRTAAVAGARPPAGEGGFVHQDGAS